MYTDTVKELPGYPVQNSPSGSFLLWGGALGSEGVVLYMILCEGDAPEGHLGWCCVHLYARILSLSLTSVSIFSVCCYSIVSISMVTHSPGGEGEGVNIWKTPDILHWIGLLQYYLSTIHTFTELLSNSATSNTYQSQLGTRHKVLTDWQWSHGHTFHHDGKISPAWDGWGV
jgi:hypothetical protein